jgi:hypothetical protein
MFERVPEGADLYLLSRIVHDWNDEKATRLLTNCRRAMALGGKVVLVEMVLPEKVGTTVRDQDERMNDLNMLVRDGGQERTQAEFAALFAAARLRLQSIVQTTLANTAIIEAAAA